MANAEPEDVPQSPEQITARNWHAEEDTAELGSDGTTSPVYPATPSAYETAQSLRRSLSVKNLMELDAKALGDKLWRGKHYQERRPRDLDALIACTSSYCTPLAG